MWMGGVDMLVNNLILIQARLNSNRLPCKVLLDLSGKTLLERCYDSVKAAKKIEKVIITTSTSEFDDVIYAKAKSFGAEVFRGELDNVLSRFYYAAKQYKPKNIIRITADNALMSGELIDELIGDFEEYSECDYMMYSEGVYGLSAEIFTYSSLEEAFHNTEDAYDCEHVTPYIHKHKLCLTPLIKEKYRLPDIRATLDTIDDYIVMSKYYDYAYSNNTIPHIDSFIDYYNKFITK